MQNILIDYLHIPIPSLKELDKEVNFKIFEGENALAILGTKFPVQMEPQYKLHFHNHITITYSKLETPLKDRIIYLVFSLENKFVYDLDEEKNIDFQYLDTIYPYGSQDPVFVGTAIEWTT